MILSVDGLGEQALNKIAELALSSQLEDSDRLKVKIKTDPQKLAQGELDSLNIDGEGLILKKDLRVQRLEINMNSIAAEPLKAIMGNIKLTRPTQGKARVFLIESDLNRAFNSQALREQMSVVDTYIDEKKVTLGVPQLNCKLHGDGQVAVDALIVLRPTEKKQRVSFTATPKIAEGERGVILDNIQYIRGKELSEELTKAFLEKARNVLDLRNFELKGISLRIEQLNIEEGQLTLIASADITQFPST